MTAEEVISILNLEPHPKEGGFFREIYRSSDIISHNCLPERYKSSHVHGTAIYYFLTPDTFSEMHTLLSDEIFHFYLGDPVEMLQLYPDGSGKRVIIGNDLERGERPQVIVPKGIWQGTRLLDGGSFCLLGTTVAPGFEYEDYEAGDRQSLISKYPEYSELITKLTHD